MGGNSASSVESAQASRRGNEGEGEEGGDEAPSLLDGGGGGRMRSRNGGGGRGLLSREATDYDTFGSIDSLIFEPKLNEQSTANKNEDINKAHKV